MKIWMRRIVIYILFIAKPELCILSSFHAAKSTSQSLLMKEFPKYTNILWTFLFKAHNPIHNTTTISRNDIVSVFYVLLSHTYWWLPSKLNVLNRYEITLPTRTRFTHHYSVGKTIWYLTKWLYYTLITARKLCYSLWWKENRYNILRVSANR